MLLLLLLVFSFSANIFASDEARYQPNLIKKIFFMGTASLNGTYYPVGNAMARLLNYNLGKTVTLAEPTAGSIDNVEYLRKKQIDLALMQSDVAWMAYNGSSVYAGNSYRGLRVLASLYTEKVQIVVRADSGIKKLSDLKGKKVALGEKNSGSAASAFQIFETAGLRVHSDYEIIYEGFAKSIESISDGYIDAIYYVGAVPADGITRLANRTPIRLIEIPAESVAKLTASYPYCSSESLAEDSYKGQKRIITLGVKALLTCSEALSPLDAQKILSVIYSNPIIVSDKKELLVELDKSAALEGVEPSMLHDGAVKFFNDLKNK